MRQETDWDRQVLSSWWPAAARDVGSRLEATLELGHDHVGLAARANGGVRCQEHVANQFLHAAQRSAAQAPQGAQATIVAACLRCFHSSQPSFYAGLEPASQFLRSAKKPAPIPGLSF